MDRATAVTGFDAQGQGLVSIILDGQIVQLLGTLRPEDRQLGVRVRAGDALTVEDVDGKRNQCTVSWQGAIASADER
jgi:VCBS repeat-containing protein